MDVNEKIVAQYLIFVKKWFYIPDIPVKVDRGYSNIDLLAFDPKDSAFRAYPIC